MPKLAYIDKAFQRSTKVIILRAIEICDEYQRQGYDLTLRQLYYQFVARGYLANSDRNYKRLGTIISDARLTGLLDWNYIVDRTRTLKIQPHWDDPQHIIGSAATGYQIDKWADQPYRVEVWIEKEALAGVFARVCDNLDVPYFACRGYVSQSAMWRAGQRFRRYAREGKQTKILHFGDHDPSGIDMTRDIEERLWMFAGRAAPTIDRIALNLDQIDEYNPPPNPAKLTDSRARDYIFEYGYESWELDALPPDVLANLVTESVEAVRDEELWQEALDREEEEREQLELVANTDWVDLIEYLRNSSGD